jgi:hypothetical protein
MRDAKWAADFPLTARRLEWFLDKETGQTVDGVIGIDVHAIEKILEAVGPVFLPDFSETVDSSNLFEKAEFKSEINFFPGSTQKRDYLSAVAKAILEKFSGKSLPHPAALVEGMGGVLSGKHLMFYLNDVPAEKVVLENNWGGSLNNLHCPAANLVSAQCFSVVEANFGANKANYYLQRKIRMVGSVSKGGDLLYQLSVSYKNNSPNHTWPGGDYKNYLRFFAPPGSKFGDLDLGDGRKPVVSPIVSADVLSGISKSQFLVREATESGYLTWGTLLTVPVGQETTVTLTFNRPKVLDLLSKTNTLNFTFLKQPGTINDSFSWEMEYPTFLSVDPNASLLDKQTRQELLVSAHKVTYNGTLRSDISLPVNFVLINP